MGILRVRVFAQLDGVRAGVFAACLSRAEPRPRFIHLDALTVHLGPAHTALAMLARIRSASLQGIEAATVSVEVDVISGLPCFTTVGLPDSTVRESRDRVRAAIRTAGFEFPAERITVNLAPADLRKEGAALRIATLAPSGGAVAPSVGPIPVTQGAILRHQLPQEPMAQCTSAASARAERAGPTERHARLAQPRCQTAGGPATDRPDRIGNVPGILARILSRAFFRETTTPFQEPHGGTQVRRFAVAPGHPESAARAHAEQSPSPVSPFSAATPQVSQQRYGEKQSADAH
jgi:Subunit ChlI of Mg-chelatase